MNRREFLKSGTLMSAVSILLRTVTLAFAGYVSRAVGAEGVGINTLVMSAYGFAVTFATSGVGLTVTRLVAAHIGEGKRESIGRTLRGAAVYSLIFSLFATAVLAAFSGFIATACLGDVRATLPLIILSLSLIPTALLGVISGYYVAKRCAGRTSMIGLISNAVRILVTVILLSEYAPRGAVFAVVALCMGASLSEIITLTVAAVVFFIDRMGERDGEERGVSLRPVANMAMPLALSSYVRSGLLSVEHAIIPRRLEKRGESLGEALSSYGSLHGMALPMVVYPMTPLSSFAQLLLPELAESEAAGDTHRMQRIARLAVSGALSWGILMAVMLFVFSEELGYTVYGSYGAGYFISVLAPVVPIMYIDHVVDAMLKGVGEQVYSMWVNILDSALSVILVFILLPVMGIEGYAVVIIAMEGFNFALSYLRLRRRIAFRVDMVGALIIPSLAAVGSAYLVDLLFVSLADTGAWAVFLKLIFAFAAYIALMIPIRAAYSKYLTRKHSA